MKKRRTIFKEEILLIFVVISLACSQDTDLTLTLQRAIGDGSDWSIGYQGDFYIATVDTNLVDKFRWTFNDEVEEQRFDLIVGTCQILSTPATSFTASCAFISGEMKSILHLNRELQSDDGGFVEFYVEESSITQKTATTTFNVKECSSSSPLHISSVDAKYNSAGNFYCDNEGDLYNSNTETKVVKTVTTCQADGTWKDGDVVQCWKAPENVKTTGNMAIKEEDELSLICEFDDSSDDVPHVETFVFYKNGIPMSTSTSATFNTDVTRNDNGGTVHCKAENIVNTNEEDVRGLSQNETITVYYKPTTPEIELLKSNKLIIENNKGILMRSDQSLSMNCDVDSNPPAECIWIFQSNENVSNECETTIKLRKSGVLGCQATNEQYVEIIPTTKYVIVTLVDEIREPTIYEQDHIKDKFDVMENSSLTVECRVDYEDELNSTFNWMFSDEVISPNKTLELTGIKPTEDGDYYCCTKDDFGENSNKFSLNVLFSPRKSKTTNVDEENNISFTWIEDSNGECEIEYYSNPVAENLVLTKNGTVVEWSLLTIQITQDKRQTLTIQKNKVTQSDKGNYSLEISSYLFPDDSMTIEFEIIVESSSNTNKAVIISCSCVGAVILISVGLFVFYRMKIKKKDTKTASTKNVRKEVDSNIDPYSTYQPSQDNTVEQKGLENDEDERMDYVNVKSIPMSSNQNVYIN